MPELAMKQVKDNMLNIFRRNLNLHIEGCFWCFTCSCRESQELGIELRWCVECQKHFCLACFHPKHLHEGSL